MFYGGFLKNSVSTFLISIICLYGCSSPKYEKVESNATGWTVNAEEGGFQYLINYDQLPSPPGMVAIEGGTFTMGRVQDDPFKDWNNEPTQQHVQSFYMDETEVTNLMYLEYLNWLKNVFPPSNKSYSNIYNSALPDTLVWRNRLGFAESLVNNYLRHPAYSEYPVVGVSWIQAVEFSNWRTNRVNELMLERQGYMTEEARKTIEEGQIFDSDTYLSAPSHVKTGLEGEEKVLDPEKNKQFAKLQDGIFYPKFRLPTEAEWEYAALAMGEVREGNLYKERKVYPWTGRSTRGEKGNHLANFKQGDGDYGGIAGWSTDNASITAPVMTYRPNDFGLYNMAGNVAEWVADVYRPTIAEEYNDFNYYRGNVYRKKVRNEDHTFKVIQNSSEIEYDTLINGKLIARELPGEIKKKLLDRSDLYMRSNFSVADNRNFADGDKRSSKYFRSFEAIDNPSKRMYNAPLYRDSATGRRNSINRTTLVNDELRVVKGGSWRDRVYWLDPAQRRFYHQDLATDYIGFRNAMSKVGSKNFKDDSDFF